MFALSSIDAILFIASRRPPLNFGQELEGTFLLHFGEVQLGYLRARVHRGFLVGLGVGGAESLASILEGRRTAKAFTSQVFILLI